MKKTRTFKPTKLTLDVLDYMFVEWLVSQDLYSKFADNIVADRRCNVPARALIRDHIRVLIENPVLTYEKVICSAFLFFNTPEGMDFWNRVSREWICFCHNFFLTK